MTFLLIGVRTDQHNKYLKICTAREKDVIDLRDKILHSAQKDDLLFTYWFVHTDQHSKYLTT